MATWKESSTTSGAQAVEGNVSNQISLQGDARVVGTPGPRQAPAGLGSSVQEVMLEDRPHDSLLSTPSRLNVKCSSQSPHEIQDSSGLSSSTSRGQTESQSGDHSITSKMKDPCTPTEVQSTTAGSRAVATFGDFPTSSSVPCQIAKLAQLNIDRPLFVAQEPFVADSKCIKDAALKTAAKEDSTAHCKVLPFGASSCRASASKSRMVAGCGEQVIVQGAQAAQHTTDPLQDKQHDVKSLFHLAKDATNESVQKKDKQVVSNAIVDKEKRQKKKHSKKDTDIVEVTARGQVLKFSRGDYQKAKAMSGFERIEYWRQRYERLKKQESVSAQVLQEMAKVPSSKSGEGEKEAAGPRMYKVKARGKELLITREAFERAKKMSYQQIEDYWRLKGDRLASRDDLDMKVLDAMTKVMGARS